MTRPLVLLPVAAVLAGAVGGGAFAPPDRKAALGQTHYSAPVAGVFGTESPAFAEEFLPPGAVLKTVEVGVTADPDFRVVQCLRFLVRNPDGTPRTCVIGREDGATFAPARRVPAGAKLVGVSGRGGWYVDAVRFHFSDGSETPEYGGPGGDTTFRTLLTKNAAGAYRGEVRGLFGHAGPHLETLGLIFWPRE